MPEYKNVVFATDYSEHAQVAFEQAKYMAGLIGGKLHIIHVTRSMPAAGEAPVPEEGEEEGCQDLRAHYPVGGAEYRLLYGNEADQIIKFADSLPNSVIVIGSRGVGFLTGLLGGGSVCDKVVANAHGPVLVVPLK